MLILDKKIWLFLIIYIAMIIALPFLYPTEFSRLNSIGISSLFSLVLIGIFVRSHVVKFSLKPNQKIINWKYLIPISVTILVYALVSSNYLNYKNTSVSLIIYTLLIAFIQTVSEELIFRGILLNNILKNTNNLSKAVIYSAILFGALHLFSLIKTNDYSSVINQVIMATMAGIFLGSFFVFCRNIYYVAFLHLLINIPAYFKRITAAGTIENTNDVSLSLADTLISSFMVFVLYSPFLLIGLFILFKAKKEFISSEPKLKKENSFSL
jgi:membrane protease YdiL (CAAX protease family)